MIKCFCRIRWWNISLSMSKKGQDPSRMSVREDDIGQIFFGSRWDWLSVPGLTDRFGKQCLWEWAGFVKFLLKQPGLVQSVWKSRWDWSIVSVKACRIGHEHLHKQEGWTASRIS